MRYKKLFTIIIGSLMIMCKQGQSMNIIRKSEREKYVNPTSVVYEYPLGDKDINGAIAEINGRYPERGYAVNNECKELAYVVSGNGKIVVEGKEILLAQGDVVSIKAGEKYYWSGNMELFLACTPAWYPEQHKNIVDENS